MQRNLSKTSYDRKKVSIFQLVYNNGSRSSHRRPTYFSFIRILSYEELQLLAVLSTLEQSATFLSLDCDEPSKDGDILRSLNFYFLGAACGLVILAVCSDYLVKQHMLFLPIYVMNCLQLAFFSFCLVYGSVAQPEAPFYPFIAIEGLLNAQVQFYLLFLTPLLIADKYRLTQEVTPAGTIIATNICLTYMICSFVRGMLDYCLYTRLEVTITSQRWVPIVLVALAIALGWKKAMAECRAEREQRRLRTASSTNNQVTN